MPCTGPPECPRSRSRGRCPIGAAQPAAEPQAASPLAPIQFCGQPAAAPRAQPPASSGPVVLAFGPCFEAQGGSSVIEPQTYLYYIQLEAEPARRRTSGFPTTIRRSRRCEDDFQPLWGTNFLDNIWVDVSDYKFPNGTVGKIVTYNMEERQRVKIVDYVGSKKIETSKIDEKLKDANAQIRLDTFIDPALVRKVQGIVQDMLREKGFQFANVTPEIQEMPGGPKLVHLTFHLDEGPKVEIRRIDFIGNKAMSDAELKAQLKDTKDNAGFHDFAHLWTWISSAIGDRSYKEAKFDEDAEKIVSFYRDHGYIKANVGVPELRVINDSDDQKTRFIELKIPVTEGERYKVGNFDVAGNTVVRTDYLKPLFKTNPGEYLLGEEDPQGDGKGARSLRRPVATSSSRGSPTTSSATSRIRTSRRRRRRWPRPRRRSPQRTRPSWTSRCGWSKGSSSSSTASRSPATRRRTTT